RVDDVAVRRGGEEARLLHVRGPERATRVRKEADHREPREREPPEPKARLREPQRDEEREKENGVHREPDRDRLAEGGEVLEQRPQTFADLVPVDLHLRPDGHRIRDEGREREEPGAPTGTAARRQRHREYDDDEERDPEVTADLVDPAREVLHDR